MDAMEFLKAKWDDVKRAVVDKWSGQITEDDLAEMPPDHATLCELIGDRCEMSKEQARQEVNRLVDQMRMNMPF